MIKKVESCHDDLAESRKFPAPDPRIRLRLDELAELQRLCSTHLTFSTTLCCPLKCAHCIVRAAPENKDLTMKMDAAGIYASQMADLYDIGIRSIGFTGGEPVLAGDQIRLLSDAAESAGISSAIVTSAFWARNLKSAAKVMRSFPHIKRWDISVDSYHSEFVPLKNITHACHAARNLDLHITIRYTYHDPMTEEDRKILEFIAGLEDEMPVFSQKVRLVGRAQELALEFGHKYNPWMKPCLTQGMVIRYDGSISPCCSSLVEERNHPFQFGNALERPLRKIHEDFVSMPLLQMIRAIGFSEIFRWIEAAGMRDEIQGKLPDDACDICMLTMTNKRIAGFLAEKTSEEQMQLRIAILVSRVLGEHKMLFLMLDRLRARGKKIEGYDLAKQYADTIPYPQES